MEKAGLSPGPIAERAFNVGFRAAAIGGVVGLSALYLFGPLSVNNDLHLVLTIALYPIFLLSVALLLGMWLGFETDESDLQRVDGDSGDPWKSWPW